MDQMEASEIIRENKTNMTSEEQMNAILQATRDLDQKKAAIYEQLMGELEPYGVRLINFKNYEIRRKRCSVLPEMQILMPMRCTMKIWITGNLWQI